MQYIYGFDNSSPDLYIEHSKMSSPKNSMKLHHYHDFFEIYYYLGSDMTYFIGSKMIHLKKYDIALIDEYTFHKTSYSSTCPEERVLFEFRKNVFDIINDREAVERILLLFKNVNKITIPAEMRDEIFSLVYRTAVSYKASTPAGLLKARLGLMDLCLTLQELSENQILQPEPSGSSSLKDKIPEVINYINEHYSSQITLEDLANRFFINKYYLCHMFQKTTGISIIEFLNGKRLVEAEKLLKYSSYSITDICGIVGFNNTNHFTGLFKKIYKCTPKYFRNNYVAAVNLPELRKQG